MTVHRSDPLTRANLKRENSHVYILSFREKLPPTVFETKNLGKSDQVVTLHHGKNSVETFIRNYTNKDVPRSHFQARGFFRKFFEETRATEGDVVLFAETSPLHYDLSLERAAESHELRLKVALDRMATTVVNTALAANGQIIQRRVKNKDLLETKADLISYINKLIETQRLVCALSGLPLQFDGTESDPQMLASLDRIDSNGHYARGNLQVVCRFINKWKSDMPDTEFRRLMTCVQDVERL